MIKKLRIKFVCVIMAIVALLLGSILGSVIHLVRMRFGASSRLAFGPYLAMGLMISAWFGSGMIAAYLGLFGL